MGSGRQILFFTTLGTITESAETDRQGIAMATLRATGVPGTATVRALSGGAMEATLDVPIGARSGSITLQATPGSLSDSGGTVDLVAVVRDQGGAPLGGAAVTFSSELGSLASRGGVVTTRPNGQAEDELTVTATEAGTEEDGFFLVSASTTNVDGEAITDEFTITVDRPAPRAAFSFTAAGGTSIQFVNESTGQEPLSYAWDFESDGTTDSTDRSPVHDYGALGTFTVTLTVSNDLGSDVAIESVNVSDDTSDS